LREKRRVSTSVFGKFCSLSFSAEQCQMLAIELLVDDDLRGRRNDYITFRIFILI